MKMTKRNKIIIGCAAAGLLYVSGYVACRLQSELIHRKTWAHGWNRHWIKPGQPEPSVEPLPFMPLHVPGDREYNAAMEQYQAEFNSIAARRRLLGIVFFPLRCVESAAWWVSDARA